MKIIEITPKKLNDMSDITEDILLLGGKLMSCLEKMSDEMYGERRSREDDDEDYNERRMSRRDREDYNERRYRGRR